MVSQKIKSCLCRFIRALVANIRSDSANSRNTISEDIEPARIEPQRLPIDDITVKYALGYIFGLINSAAYDKGAGVVVVDIDDLRERNTFSGLLCKAFRYLAIYTENTESANIFADQVYEKYGLPIAVLDIDEAGGCRYPVMIDLVSGKVRYGRDVCVDGAVFEGEEPIGISVGSRVIPIKDEWRNTANKTIDNLYAIKYN